MLIYVDEVQRDIDDTWKYAELIREKFDAGRNAAELLLDARALDMRMDKLYALLPDGRMIGYGSQHSRFTVHYLERNDIKSCGGDIVDICRRERRYANGRASWHGWMPIYAGTSFHSSAPVSSIQRYGRRSSSSRRACAENSG
jgi:hypothetical protein